MQRICSKDLAIFLQFTQCNTRQCNGSVPKTWPNSNNSLNAIQGNATDLFQRLGQTPTIHSMQYKAMQRICYKDLAKLLQFTQCNTWQCNGSVPKTWPNSDNATDLLQRLGQTPTIHLMQYKTMQRICSKDLAKLLQFTQCNTRQCNGSVPKTWPNSYNSLNAIQGNATDLFQRLGQTPTIHSMQYKAMQRICYKDLAKLLQFTQCNTRQCNGSVPKTWPNSYNSLNAIQDNATDLFQTLGQTPTIHIYL